MRLARITKTHGIIRSYFPEHRRRVVPAGVVCCVLDGSREARGVPEMSRFALKVGVLLVQSLQSSLCPTKETVMRRPSSPPDPSETSRIEVQPCR